MAYKRKVYQEIANLVIAIGNCKTNGNSGWLEKHTDRLTEIVNSYLPHGSGFDVGVEVDLDRSKEDRIIFCTSFHHMNDVGYYDGWTDHDVIMVPSLVFGFTLRVTGRDRNEIKDYIHQAFEPGLNETIEV